MFYYCTMIILEFPKPKPPVQAESTEEVKRAKKRRRPVGDIIKEYEGQEKFFMGKWVNIYNFIIYPVFK